jgi:hypothetical protein
MKPEVPLMSTLSSRLAIALYLALPGFMIDAKAAVCEPTLAPRASGPQVADDRFSPSVSKPAYRKGEGPVVYLDEAHHNYHTIDGRYATFAELLRKDGFVVSPLQEKFSAEGLLDAEILVIANALAPQNAGSELEWRLPTYSAFAEAEISAIEQWVSTGGALLLIADHMPWPGAAEDLGRAFGIQMTNSFATDATCADDEYLFERADGSLGGHPITDGRSEGERIDYVRTFTGQAFWLTQPGVPILKLKSGSVVLLPTLAWEFSSQTPRIPGDGLLQGAVLEHGNGRVAVFGEAAMFSAQVSGAERRPMGMNMPGAEQNPQFLLNVMHWLSEFTSEE